MCYLQHQQNPITISVSEPELVITPEQQNWACQEALMAKRACISLGHVHVLLTMTFPVLPTSVWNYNNANIAAKTRLDFFKTVFKKLHCVF